MFPFLSIHYKEIIYGAYKSDDPQVYIKEILEPYDIKESHVKFLIKYIRNRDIYAGTDLIKTVKKEESKKENVHGLHLGRFIYYATTMCHIWCKDKNIMNPTIEPTMMGNVVCFADTNVALPYIWFNFDSKLTLVRSNLQCVDHIRIQLRLENSTRKLLFDLHTGVCYDCRSSKDTLILHMETLAIPECATGIRTDIPFCLVLTHTKYILSGVFYNKENGHVEPLPISLHPIE